MSEKIKKILEEIRPEFNFAESEDFIEDGYLDFDVIIDGIDIVPENFDSVDSIIKLLQKSGVK